ncbi:MAG: ATP-binding protein [Melioribacter sp.]|uniref:sensor histidine kinase n=1 Tax=Rosettibacter primus TaxID=3111523 RepID=UPI00247CE0EE|nr:ATP-binding protein [Melioribacter sp.]
MSNFWDYIFIATSIISALGLIFIIYSTSEGTISSRLFILILFLVVCYLFSHAVHFLIISSSDVTVFDRSCHSFLLLIVLALSFFSYYFPENKKMILSLKLILIIPSIVLLILLWNGDLIIESHAHHPVYEAHYSSIYPSFLIWYLFLLGFSIYILTKKIISLEYREKRLQILSIMFGLILSNFVAFIFGLFLPWYLGFYYLVEISQLAFLVGVVSMTVIALGKFNMFPVVTEKLQSFSVTKKLFYSAVIIVPIIILMIVIPLTRIIFEVKSLQELQRHFIVEIFSGVLVSISMAYIITRFIAMPLNKLKHIAQEIQKGNYGLKVNINSNDEFGELAETFNNMSKKLKQDDIKLAENKERISLLLNAFEKSLAAIAIVNTNFKIIEANTQFYNILEKPKENLGHSSIDVLQFHKSSELFKKIIEEVNTKNVFIGEIKIELENKKIKDLLLSVTKIFSPNFELKGYLFVEIDITDKKKLEAEMLRSEKLAALGKMSAILAHEIKTPLTSIKMNVDILSQTLSLNDDDKECLEIIKKETNRLTQLVKEVLQFSKTSELNLSKVNLKLFSEEIFQLTKAQNLHKQITFINETDDVEIFVDSDKFKQVLLNLVQNSIDAIVNEGIIHLSSQVNEDEILIYVKDNGNGIEETDKIFDPFFTTKPSGTGLGLSLSQKIIEQHGGTLRLISSKAGETIFEIKLPFRNGPKNFSN